MCEVVTGRRLSLYGALTWSIVTASSTVDVALKVGFPVLRRTGASCSSFRGPGSGDLLTARRHPLFRRGPRRDPAANTHFSCGPSHQTPAKSGRLEVLCHLCATWGHVPLESDSVGRMID